jgi:hypothetical protein
MLLTAIDSEQARLRLTGTANKKAVPRRQAERRYHAGSYDGQKKPENATSPFPGQAPQYSPALTHRSEWKKPFLKLLDVG